ncbi:hypothetical protein GII30_11895 [Gordonia amarae]|uniref:Uncharacterized protein n=2 Tax=Gordonia amarae TaxID=36821 RepID=G7GJG4_9ACTN|nr:hypothetical protein [Gordonia amarae]MCS3879089.1 hypothetical protein [Gordonia amarae]QHN17620.1 hypothetical protein GII35_12105 [Gordonia amarae]QHN22146.1 hypothetical protein GII34_11885 [Gordonia amarae]QHN31027.1 hypothetical protein GII32_12060 [Gordonia amarae]QHN39772.1 hypothetical protein GII30_11895 [Gordonia amarae]
MARVNEISSGTNSGVWTVVTQTSTYLLDFNEMTLLRAPGVGVSDSEEWAVSRLRRDSEDIPLLGVRTCRVGESAQFWVRAADDPDVRTWRITTPVESIEKIG